MSCGFTLFPQVCILQWRIVTVLYLGACRSSAGGTGYTRGHGDAGWQQETGSRLDSKTAAGALDTGALSYVCFLSPWPCTLQ